MNPYNLTTSDLVHLSHGTQQAAVALIVAARTDGWHLDQLVHVLEDADREAGRWKEAWAQGQVDKDRAVREASDRALDCAEHGKVIADLEKQVHYFSRLQDRTDNSRRELLSGLHAIQDYAERIRAGHAKATTVQLADALLRYIDKALGAHMRRWK